MFEDELPKWQEQIDAARRTNERLGPLAAEKAKKYEHLTLEQVMVHWARVTSRRGGSEFESLDDLEAEVMAIGQVLGAKFRERGTMLRAVGFDLGEPMQ